MSPYVTWPQKLEYHPVMLTLPLFRSWGLILGFAGSKEIMCTCDNELSSLHFMSHPQLQPSEEAIALALPMLLTEVDSNNIQGTACEFCKGPLTLILGATVIAKTGKSYS